MRSWGRRVLVRAAKGLGAGILGAVAAYYGNHPVWGPLVTAVVLAGEKAIQKQAPVR